MFDRNFAENAVALLYEKRGCVFVLSVRKQGGIDGDIYSIKTCNCVLVFAP